MLEKSGNLLNAVLLFVKRLLIVIVLPVVIVVCMLSYK